MYVRAAGRRKRSARFGLLLCALAVLVLAYAVLYPPVARRAAHPLRYEELVEAAAQEFGLEEAHIYAVILCESSFRADATSSAGARGLMQIMPETGEWIAGKFGEEDVFSADMLYDPALNIRYGCWFLSYLSRLYENDLDTVTAAYHAGAGNVRKWLANPDCSMNGRTIDTTPFPATNRYMEKVRSAYEVYTQKLSKKA